jgi:hypothetical protein
MTVVLYAFGIGLVLYLLYDRILHTPIVPPFYG